MQSLEAQALELGLETGWDDSDSQVESVAVEGPRPLYKVKGDKDDAADKAEKGKKQTAKESVSDSEKEFLVHTSLKTAVAIALHNFPEGVATFVAALQDPKVGAVLAVAIALHNIPEGLCVALPVYYANKSKLQAFLYAFVSGIAEPVAALVYWLAVGGTISDSLFGVMFGVVAGMMVLISVRELLPTAISHDPHNATVTRFFCAGMLVMAVSLVLFSL